MEQCKGRMPETLKFCSMYLYDALQISEFMQTTMLDASLLLADTTCWFPPMLKVGRFLPVSHICLWAFIELLHKHKSGWTCTITIRMYAKLHYELTIAINVRRVGKIS